MSKEYSRLPNEEEHTESSRASIDAASKGLLDPEAEKFTYRSRNLRQRWAYLHIPTLYTLIIILLVVNSLLFYQKHEDIALGGLYTPARGIVEYYERTFTWNFWDKGEYMGYPTEEKDKLWSDLYNFGTSGIPNEQAAHLHDETVAVPGSDSDSLIMLDVWHQLHCLNAVRRAIYPERWPEIWEKHENGSINYNTVEMKHVDHCIDHIRQALMCFGDVSPTSFFFDPKRGNNPKTVGTHMCRNFDKIRDWALERRVMDFSMQDKILGMGHKHESEHSHGERSEDSNGHAGNHHVD